MLALRVRGYHPLRPGFPDRFHFSYIHHWPGPRSLATTNGVSVDVLSSGYLDVSVPRVRFKPLCIQDLIPSSDNWNSCTSWQNHKAQEFQSSKVGFPIRKFTDQSLFAAPRDLSQRTTSFIASQRQGIHRMPLRHLIVLIFDTYP